MDEQVPVHRPVMSLAGVATVGWPSGFFVSKQLDVSVPR